MRGWQSSLVMILLVALAGTTAYFASRSVYLQKQLQLRNAVATDTPTDSSSPSTNPTSPASVSATPTTTDTTSSTPAAAPSDTPTATTTAEAITVVAADRLSQPSETYTVVQGDTLYGISLKQNISQDKLARVNNLKDPFLLKLGQVLVIPTVDAKQNIFEVDYTADTNRAASDQQTVTAGKTTWRLNPATVALAENGGVFGLTATDQYQLTASDPTKGTAIVTATQSANGQTQTYKIDLVQPAQKGPTGIWAIVRIAVSS